MTTMTSTQTTPVTSELLRTILLFGIPTLLMYVSFWSFRPFLVSIGLSPYHALVTSLTVPLALLLVASLVGFHFEKLRNPELSLRDRFRYPRFERIFLLRGVGLYLLGTLLFAILFVINGLVLDLLKVTIPENATPFFGNTSTIDMALYEDFIGEPLKGNYGVFILYLIMLFFNIVGEELWWRGYILPNQERSFGSSTWIIHGIFWNVFHIFKWWQLVALLSVTLLLPYAAQKYKENWSTLIAHLLFNGLFGVFMFAEVFL